MTFGSKTAPRDPLTTAEIDPTATRRFRLARGMRRAGTAIADLVWPPQCLRCRTPVAVNGTLCPGCWPLLRFVERPYCGVCGTPFEIDLGPAAICGACSASPPAWGRARAAVIYNDGSKPVILGFKHSDRTDLAPVLGRWMAHAGADLLAEADGLIPVPLHWTRLFLRRYNQAALLAQAVGRTSRVPVLADALIRRKRTPKLGHLGPAARRRLLQGAIAVDPQRLGKIEGARLVLIDDVHTTGATLAACAAVLLRAGAGHVDVLTFARTVKADPG